MLKQRGSVPNLVVAERVFNRMAAAAATHMSDETGEAMVGLVVPGVMSGGVPTLYVLDTIAPDDSAIRQFATFQQGDARQDELIWWLQENWRSERERKGGLFRKLANPNKWDVPLRYLGDWHKQPGHMIQPSGGDLNTALDWLLDADNEMDFLLAPIVTLGHPSTVQPSSPMANFVMVALDDGEAMRVDFWYIDQRTGLFQPISPAIYPDDQLPALVQYPWHLINEKRMEAEMRLFQKEKLFHSISFWNVDNEAPLEICFLAGMMGSDHLLLLITDHDYPKQAPEVRVAPFLPMGAGDDMYKVFETAFKRSQPLALELEWSPSLYLVDVVHAAEAKLNPTSPNARKSKGESAAAIGDAAVSSPVSSTPTTPIIGDSEEKTP